MQGSVKLNNDLGGSGFPNPFRKPDPNVPRWDSSVNRYNGDAYGNSGINDYFAEAFSWTIYNGITPQGVSAWVNATITNQVSMFYGK